MIKHIVKQLIKEKIINSDQMRTALELHNKTGKGLLEILVDQKYIGEQNLVYHICKEAGIPSVNPEEYNISPDIIKLIPKQVAIRLNVIPLTCFKSNLVVAISDPSNISVIDEAKFLTGYNIIPTVASHSAIKNAIDNYYSYERTIGIDMHVDFLDIEDVDQKINSKIDNDQNMIDQILSELGKQLYVENTKQNMYEPDKGDAPINGETDLDTQENDEVILITDEMDQEDENINYDDKYITISLYSHENKSNEKDDVSESDVNEVSNIIPIKKT
jgi:hypothetical protein